MYVRASVTQVEFESIVFPPFRLEPGNARLWRGSEIVPLRGKTFGVLRYLVERHDQLVTRDELLSALWPDTHGAEALPRGCIHELREVLEDDTARPRFIETVGRRQGYRFIAPVTTNTYVDARPRPRAKRVTVATRVASVQRQPLVVGRTAEFARLDAAFERALDGERRLVFVTGEPGIGKTTLVDTFLGRLRRDHDVWSGWGQCVEQYGAGEAYLPVLEALGRLCRSADGERVIALLDRHAPMWLMQMPALLDSQRAEDLRRRVQGGDPERMVRELSDGLDALAAEKPLVLVIEDLQWSDYSTVDLVAALASRRESARLLFIATYRPADVVVSRHPVRVVKQQLQARGKCEDVLLGSLNAAEVGHYLTIRFAGNRFPQELDRAIYGNTDGNPLFVVNLLDYLVATGGIREADGLWRVTGDIHDVVKRVPDTLRALIEAQIDRLSEPEKHLLEAGSLAGDEYSSLHLAALLGEPAETIEDRCDELTRRSQFIRALGPLALPDGSTGARYGFLHTLYQKVFYERMSATRRARLHRRFAAELERRHAANRNGRDRSRAGDPFRAGRRGSARGSLCRESGAERESTRRAPRGHGSSCEGIATSRSTPSGSVACRPRAHARKSTPTTTMTPSPRAASAWARKPKGSWPAR